MNNYYLLLKLHDLKLNLTTSFSLLIAWCHPIDKDDYVLGINQ